VTLAHPKYQQIADRLRGQIGSGVLEPGERLPSEPDLATEYDASRNTVRLAIALLINQGLVVSRQGLGTFVVEPTKPFTARSSVRPLTSRRWSG
jgi:GntR family transcriptional regulator